MTNRDARALGRWCHRHQKRFRRIALDHGWITGCPDCWDERRIMSVDEALAVLRGASPPVPDTTEE